MATQRAARGHSVPQRRHGSPRHGRRRRLARAGPARARRRGTMAPLHLRAARADDCRNPQRRDLRLRSQRHLATARHGSRRRSGRARALLKRLCADRRHARVSQHHSHRAEGRVRHRERRTGSHDHRQAQRQRAAGVRRRPVVYCPRLRLPPAESQRQSAHRPRPRQRSAGPLHSEHAAARRPRSAVLRLPQRQAAARGVSGSHRRAADMGSARRQRVGAVAGLAVRREDGSAERCAGPHRFQQPGDLPCAARRADAAGCRRRSSA